MNMKKIAILALSLCMIAAIAVTGTIAYFTDTDEATNVFTVGNVQIDLIESKLHRENDKATNDQIKTDAENYQDYLVGTDENPGAGVNMMPGEWVKKAPYVVNTGANDAYVRVSFEVTRAFDDNFEVTEYTTAQERGEILKTVVTKYDANGEVTTGADYAKVKYTYTYAEPIEAGEMTYRAPFWRFRLMNGLDQEVLEALKADDLKIYVFAEAIQAEGFDTAVAAFTAYDAQ